MDNAISGYTESFGLQTVHVVRQLVEYFNRYVTKSIVKSRS